VKISLIQAPYWLGNAESPLAAGPTRIVEAGAAEALREAGHDVELVSVERDEQESDDVYWNEIESSFVVVGLVAERVREAVERGSFPVVLATNCFNTVGIVAGGPPDVGVVWFDAHADFSTTELSPSGFLDGMGLSMLTGACWDTLRESVPGYRAVPEENVILVGMRDGWDHEQERLERSGISVVPPDEIGGGLDPALDALRERVADVHLHLDLDVLDRSEGPVNHYATRGGPSAAEVAAAIQAIGHRFRLRSAAMTAYVPTADTEGRVPPVAVRLLGEIATAAQTGVPA
jgi:arginase